MSDQSKSKAELIQEIQALRKQLKDSLSHNRESDQKGDISERKTTEHDLAKHRYYLEKAQEMGQIGTWELDLQKNELTWTDQNYKNFGVPLGTTPLTYETFLNAIHPDDRDFVSDQWSSALKGSSYDIEHRVLIDNKVRWMREKASVEFDTEENALKAIGFTQDITDRKKAGELLVTLKEQLQTSIDNMPSGYILWDTDLNVIEWNKASEAIFGYSREEVLGKNPVNLIVPENVRHLVVDVLKKLQVGEVASYSEQDNNIRKNGEIISCKWFNTPLGDKDGNIFGILSIAQDITKQLLSEQALHRINTFNESLIKTIPFGLNIVDLKGKLLFVNPAMEALVGGGSIGKQCWKVYKDDKHQCTNCPLHQPINPGETHIIESDKILGGKTFEISHIGMEYENQPALLEVFYDVTEHKKIENQLHLQASIMANMSEAVVLVRAEDRSIVYVNSEFENLFGYSQTELIGKDISIVNATSTNSPEETANEIGKVLADTGQWAGEIQNIKKDGSEFWCFARVDVFEHPEYGEVFVSVHRDISEIKAIETQLRNSQALLLETSHLTKTGGWEFDLENSTGSFTSETFKIYGLPPESGIPTVEDGIKYYAPEARPIIQKAFKDIVELHKPYDLELPFVNAKGENLWVRAIGHVDTSAEKIKRIYGVIQDITNRKQAELDLIYAMEKVEKSEERFNLAMKASNDGLYDWNLVTNEIYYSPGWKKMLGYEDHELPNDFSVWEKTTDPDDVKKSWKLQQQLISKEIDRFVLEFKMKHKDGHWVDVLSRAEAFFDKDGKANRIVGTHQDITERKSIEIQQRQSENRLRLAMSASNAGSWVWEIESGEVIWDNRMEEIFGFEHGGFDGSYDAWKHVVHPEDVEEADRQTQLAVSTRSSYDFEYRLNIEKEPGCWKIVHAQAIVITDENGEAIQMAGLCRDITEQKLADELLKEAEENYSKLFNMSRDGFVINKGNGEIIHPNPAYAKMLGYTAEEILNVSWRDITPSKWLEWELKHQGSKLVERGYSDLYEKEYIRKDGSVFPVEVQAFRLDDSEHLDDVKIAAFVRDISERKHSEEKRLDLEEQLRQAQKLEAIGTMAGGIAHDFNNILQTQLLHAEIMQRQLPEESKFANNIQHIINAGNHARELVKSILTFSRQNELQAVPVKIQNVLSETLKMLRSIFPASIEINADIDMSVDSIIGDPTQIQQIIINLCNNASQAIGSSSGVVNISLQKILTSERTDMLDAYPSSSSLLELVVSDDGIGMSPEIVSRVFDPFFTTKQVGEGTGLGLSVIHGIMTDMGGEIKVSSQEGVGTTFTMIFPISSSDKAHSKARNLSNSSNRKKWNKAVLLVEDDPDILQITKTILKDHGFTVTTGKSGREGIAMLHDDPEKYDLIITDLAMPKVSGLDFSKYALELIPNVPIILMSGNLNETIAKECEYLGIRSLMKPWLENDLINEIEALDLEQSE